MRRRLRSIAPTERPESLSRRRSESGRNGRALALRLAHLAGRGPFGASPARCAKPIDRIRYRSADQGVMFRIGHQDLLVPVDNRSRLKQDGGHPRVLQHDQLIEAVDACVWVEEVALALLHERLRVVRGVLQPPSLQLATEQLREL